MVAKKTCPVCRSEKITNFLSRELVPVYQNMVFESQELAVGANRGNLRLACCEECGFIFNQSSDCQSSRTGKIGNYLRDRDEPQLF